MADKRLTYVRLVNLLKELAKKYEKVSAETLKNEIRMNIASSTDIMERHLRTMINTGLITEVDNMTFSINV